MQNAIWRMAYNEINETPQKCLNKIIERIKNQQMTAFVGAGFSKNANQSFPDWAWLLVDLYKKITPNSEKQTDDEIVAKIRQEGESTFAQRYLNSGKKREELDLYIENKLNPIDKSHNWLFTVEQLLKINWSDVVTTNWDTILEQANLNGILNYEVVKSSKQLKNKNHKRIVKLNGTLRSNKEIDNQEYEFDGCTDYLYVISTDDFMTYKKKHEAFSNFMKVQFLENSFCLFGFSGNDPNFQYWVSELKHIMTKGGDTEIPNEIFLINASDDSLSDIDKQFFYNNFIFNIRLSDIVDSLVEDEETRKTFFRGDTRKRNISAEFSFLFQKLFELTEEQKISDLYSEFFSESRKLFNEILQRKASGFIKEHIKEYIKLPLFLYNNISYSNMLLGNIQIYCDNAKEINSEGFTFLYRWCLSNFYKLFDILEPETSEILIKHFRENILINDINHPFSELVLQYYKDIEYKDSFENFVEELKKLGTNENIYIYQKLLFLFDSFAYDEFQKQLDAWFPEKAEKVDSLYVLRKIRLIYAYNTDFHNADLANKADELFRIAENNCDVENEPQLYLFIILYHKNLIYSYGDNKELQYKVDELKSKGYTLPYLYFEKLIERNKTKEKIKPNEDSRYTVSIPLIEYAPSIEKVNYFNVRRILNIIEYAGLPAAFLCDADEYYSLLEILYNYDKNDEKTLSMYIYNSFCFYGNSASEDILRYIASKTLSYISENSLKTLKNSVLKIIESKTNAGDNPKTYIYFLTEILKRLKIDDCENIFDYYVNLIKNDNQIFFNLVTKGEIWGIQRPFFFFLKNCTNEKDLQFLLKWIVEKYVEDNEINNKNQAWSPWLSYLDTIINNEAFIDEKKNIAFQSADIKNIIFNNLEYSYPIFLHVYDYLTEEDKEKAIKWLENNFTLSVNSYYLQKIKSERIKKKCFEIIQSNIDDKTKFSDSRLGIFMETLKYSYELSNEDYSLMYNLVIRAYRKFYENKKSYTKINYEEEIRQWFYLLGNLCYENESESKQDFINLRDKIFEEYKTVNQELLNFDWIYKTDAYNFRINVFESMSYFSYTDDKDACINYVNMFLSRIIFSDSREYEGVIKILIDSIENKYFNRILRNEKTLELFKQLCSKFSFEIPYCYDDLFIKEQMERLYKIINIEVSK